MAERGEAIESGRKMRIALVTQYFYPENFKVNDLVVELVARGHEVSVLTGNPNYPAGRFLPGYGGLRTRREHALGAQISRVPHLARGNGSGIRLLLNYISFALSASFFGRFLLRGRFDAVFVYEPSPLTVAIPGLVMAKLTRSPALLWAQDLWPQTLFAMGVVKGRVARKMAHKFTSVLHRGMDAVLVQSPAFRRPIEEQGVKSERIEYVPNWAEDLYLPVVVPEDAPERAMVPAGFNVLFAGNLGEAQGLETLVDAMSRLRNLPELNWIVLGDGRRMSWMRDAIEAAGLGHRVHLIGRRPAESMPTWFSLADVLIATLKADPVFDSTIPSKLQSYLACGRPVVVSMDGEGARVVDESGAGRTAAAGDGEGLSKAVRALYDASESELMNMSRNALAYYQEHFSREEVINTIEDAMTREVARRDERRNR